MLVVPMLAVGLIIRLSSSGPALFRQQRVGRDRSTFTFYKFRTMRCDGADTAHRMLIERELAGESVEVDGSFKLSGDTRITRVGHWLRKSSIDELPQLFNVLSGQMSLVGPRPCLLWEADLFPPAFQARFSVRPGITGLWQVSGRSRLGTLEMLMLDVEYVRRRGVVHDLKILLMTIPSMLRGGGAR
ncbi:MAG: sugar transferase [Pseudonocardia sp.]|nr:sugar transferase [Pseudonocardia sp.]